MSEIDPLVWACLDMPHLPFASLCKLPESPGIYIVYSADKVIYVGKSKNLRQRLKNHHQHFESLFSEPGLHIAWEVWPEGDRVQLRSHENALIRFFKPPLNKTHQLKNKRHPSLVCTEREKHELTQSEVAKRAHMSIFVLCKIENGRRRLFADEIARLAHAIGCDPRDLIPKLPEDKTSMTATEEVIHAN